MSVLDIGFIVADELAEQLFLFQFDFSRFLLIFLYSLSLSFSLSLFGSLSLHFFDLSLHVL